MGMTQQITNMGHKMYLTDGAYVDYDGFAVHLTTENGLRVDNRVVLEPEAMVQLFHWAKNLGQLDINFEKDL